MLISYGNWLIVTEQNLGRNVLPPLFVLSLFDEVLILGKRSVAQLDFRQGWILKEGVVFVVTETFKVTVYCQRLPAKMIGCKYHTLL